MFYAVDCPHIPITTHNFNNERSIAIKIYFTYYNQYKNGIDIVFVSNTLLFLSCTETENNLHATSNFQNQCHISTNIFHFPHFFPIFVIFPNKKQFFLNISMLILISSIAIQVGNLTIT